MQFVDVNEHVCRWFTVIYGRKQPNDVSAIYQDRQYKWVLVNPKVVGDTFETHGIVRNVAPKSYWLIRIVPIKLPFRGENPFSDPHRYLIGAIYSLKPMLNDKIMLNAPISDQLWQCKIPHLVRWFSIATFMHPARTWVHSLVHRWRNSCACWPWSRSGTCQVEVF